MRKLKLISTSRLAAAGVMMLIGASATWGQSAEANLAKELVGSWTLVSQYVEQDGKRVEAFGPGPKGFLIYDANRRYVSILLRSDLPKFASNNRLTGTSEEYKAIVQGSMAFYGQWSIDEKGLLRTRIDGATYPNWDGQVQPREVSFAGDEMKTCIPGGASIGGTACSVWKRVK